MSGHPVMQLLVSHVPITLLCDVLAPPCSHEVLVSEARAAGTEHAPARVRASSPRSAMANASYRPLRHSPSFTARSGKRDVGR